MNSRSEGGIGTPAWKFVDVRNLTLINPANEGAQEIPAVFYFKRCRDVTILNPQIATTDVPYASNQYSDGMQFIHSENCHIIGGSAESFVGIGDGSARMIGVDKGSTYITGKGITTASSNPLSDFDIQGNFCRFEILGGPSELRRVEVIDTFPPEKPV